MNKIEGQITFDELEQNESEQKYSSADEFIADMRGAQSKDELFKIVDKGHKSESAMIYSSEQQAEWSKVFDEKMTEFRKTGNASRKPGEEVA